MDACICAHTRQIEVKALQREIAADGLQHGLERLHTDARVADVKPLQRRACTENI